MTAPARLPLIDLARGVALIGMVIFHLTFDLEFFGLIAPGTVMSLPWILFARTVAGSFVFLAGVSLVLAHAGGIRWNAFWRGTGVIALAAIGVSVATYIAMPQAWVFFGILHVIAVSRLLGLGLLRLPVWGLVLLGVIVWAAPYVWQSEVMNPRALAWIGFASAQPLSMDLEPLFPWFGPFLLGMALAKTGLIPPYQVKGLLVWAGRRSLWIYLAHQPILMGSLWAILMLTR